jgi:hypothetical protein
MINHTQTKIIMDSVFSEDELELRMFVPVFLYSFQIDRMLFWKISKNSAYKDVYSSLITVATKVVECGACFD